jgi:hypothetical protein
MPYAMQCPTTEARPGFALVLGLAHHLPSHTKGPHVFAPEALGYLPAVAWQPSARGLPHYNRPLGALLNDIGAFDYICRSTILFFHSAFDSYLQQRVKPLPSKSKSYLVRLACPRVLEGRCRPKLKAVLAGDLCRYLRNRIVHETAELSVEMGDKILTGWMKRDEDVAATIPWKQADENCEVLIRMTVEEMVKNAGDQQARARAEQGPVPPLDYFYMLFFFADLNRLAFQLDQSLLSEKEVEERRYCINSSRRELLREDIVVGPAIDPVEDWPAEWPQGAGGRFADGDS